MWNDFRFPMWGLARNVNRIGLRFTNLIFEILSFRRLIKKPAVRAVSTTNRPPNAPYNAFFHRRVAALAATLTLDDTAIVATVVGETTTSEAGPKNYAKSGQPHRTARPQLNYPESQLANPGVKGSRANSGSVVTIVLKTKAFRNGPHRSPGVLY
jgi:hypothetical protein